MSDLGPARRFLGIEIEKKEDGFCISQQAYIDTILRRFRLLDAKPARTPLDPQVNLNNPHCEDKSVERKEYLSIVGSLMYAVLGSRPDIAFSVTALSRYNVQPLEMHLTAAKRVLRYLKVTSNLSIHYQRLSHSELSTVGYTDSDCAENLKTRKSFGGCDFGLGYTNWNQELVTSGLVHWQAKSQSVVALSMLEAEYIASSHATRESLWIRRILEVVANTMWINISKGPIPIGCDNQGAIKLIISGVVKQKSKHIDVKYHHVHYEQTKGSVNFQYVTSAVNPADLLPKPLATPWHMQLLHLIDLMASDPASPITQLSSPNTEPSHSADDSGKKKGVRFGKEKGCETRKGKKGVSGR